MVNGLFTSRCKGSMAPKRPLIVQILPEIRPPMTRTFATSYYYPDEVGTG
jgi:hypothetical protein